MAAALMARLRAVFRRGTVEREMREEMARHLDESTERWSEKVPAGQVMGLPVGISFFGRAWTEPALFRIAHAFEQATRHRRPPKFVPTLA